MPRGKQSVSALGKSWSMMDLENLQQATDMLIQLNQLLDKFADSSSKDIDKWIDKRQKILDSLKGMNIQVKTEGARIDKDSVKAMQQEASEALNLLNILKEQNTQLEKAQKTTQKTVRQRQQERAEQRRANSFSNYGVKNIGSFLVGKYVNSDSYKSKVESKKQETLNIEAKAIKAALDEKGHHNVSDEKIQEIAQRRLEADRLKSPEAKKAIKQQEKNTKKLGLAGDVLNEAGQLLVKIGNRIVDLFFKGAQKQVDAYNNTYDSVAARLNIDRNTYRSQWTNVNRQIKSAGLTDNIATSAVMEQWDALAKTGMSEGQVFETALDTVITQKIVPYLDTTSKEFSIVNSRLNNNFVKDIRGINKFNKEIAGNNFVTQDLLNTIIDQVQPMSDEAIQNLAQGSAEATAMINKLIGDYGYSEAAAKSLVTQYYKAQKYPNQTLRSSPTEIISYITARAKNLSYYDNNDINNIIGVEADTDQLLIKGTGGYKNNASGLNTSLVAEAMGMDFDRASSAYNAYERGMSGAQLAQEIDAKSGQFALYGDEETQNLVDGIYNTEKEMQELTMENISTEMAQLQAKMGAVGDLIVDAIKGIGTILITKIFTDGIGNIAGMIGGSGSGAGIKAAGGLAKMLGAAGPIGIGVGAAAAATAALVVAANHISQSVGKAADKSNNSDNINKAGEYAASQGWIANTKAAKNAYGINELQQANKKGFTSDAMTYGTYGLADLLVFDSDELHGKSALYNQMNFEDSEKRKDLMGDNVSWTKKGSWEAKDALDDYRRNHEDEKYNNLTLYMLAKYLETQSGSANNKAAIAGALEVAAVYQGLAGKSAIMSPIKKYLGAEDFTKNKSSLGEFLNTVGIKTVADLGNVYDFLDGLDVYLMTGDGFNFLGFPSTFGGQDALRKDFNLLRKGTNRVPYDNYPALLHEDEVVLTASTANELRTLVSEYRDTKHQSYNFETIIQDQTTALCSKIDELIRVVQGSGWIEGDTTDTTTKNSMKKMKSVFSLLQ